MFGILTVTVAQQTHLWKNLLLRLFPARGLRMEGGHYRMAMFRLTQVTLPRSCKPQAAQRRVRLALEQFRQNGVRRVMLPLEYRELAKEFDLACINHRAVLEACGSDAVLQACRENGLRPEHVCVTVCGEKLGREAASQVLTLATAVRTVRLPDRGNMTLANQLWNTCGIVARGALPTGVPTVAMVLAGGTPPPAALAVNLTGDVPDWPGEIWTPDIQPPADAMAKMPEGADSSDFAAALFLSGALQAREIRVSRLDIRQTTQYNKESVTNHLL